MALIDKPVYRRFSGSFVTGNYIYLITDEFTKNIRFDKVALKIVIKLGNRRSKIKLTKKTLHRCHRKPPKSIMQL